MNKLLFDCFLSWLSNSFFASKAQEGGARRAIEKNELLNHDKKQSDSWTLSFLSWLNESFSMMEANFPLISQIFRFGVVGVIAASVHFGVVVYFVQAFAWAPLVANIGGFVVAFQLSYWGHRTWTFYDSEVQHHVAYSKLLFVQLLNLTINEILFYFFLSLHLPYTIALLIVLAILPVLTFIVSKWWVFG